MVRRHGETVHHAAIDMPLNKTLIDPTVFLSCLFMHADFIVMTCIALAVNLHCRAGPGPDRNPGHITRLRDQLLNIVGQTS